jgi:hypothetical protein
MQPPHDFSRVSLTFSTTRLAPSLHRVSDRPVAAATGKLPLYRIGRVSSIESAI